MKAANYRPRPLMDLAGEEAGPVGENREDWLDELPTIRYPRDTPNSMGREAAKAAAQIHANWRLMFAVYPEYMVRARKALGPQATLEQLLRYMFVALACELHPDLQTRPSKKKPVERHITRLNKDERILVEQAHYMHTHRITEIDKGRSGARRSTGSRSKTTGRNRRIEAENRNPELWSALLADPVYALLRYKILFEGLDVSLNNPP